MMDNETFDEVLNSFKEADSIVKRLKTRIAELEEENKKLNTTIENTKIEQEADRKHIEQLEEENKNLKIEIWWLMWERDGLQMVVERLHKELNECECSFWFENDEVWFWKREYKRLKKWIKDHCKWYWNLFPEDEMRRQRKKADKKRKKTKEEEELSKYKKQYEHSMWEDDELIYEEWLYD